MFAVAKDVLVASSEYPHRMQWLLKDLGPMIGVAIDPIETELQKVAGKTVVRFQHPQRHGCLTFAVPRDCLKKIRYPTGRRRHG